MTVNKHSNGYRNEQQQQADIDDILNGLSDELNNEKEVDDTKISVSQRPPPALLFQKKSTTIKADATKAIKKETTTTSQDTTPATQHSSQWTMFFILCILGNFNRD